MNKMKNLRFEVQDPRSKFQGPRFNIQLQDLKQTKPKTEMQDHKSQPQDPRSKIQPQDPESKTEPPRSTIQDP
jgi:hypothetical protein